MNTQETSEWQKPAPIRPTDGLCTLRFDELRSTNVIRCEQVFHPLVDWSPCDWATAMAGECGEACNNVKKLRRLDGADAPRNTPEHRQQLQNDIGKELADLVIYADLLAARLGIDLGKAVVQKFNEVSDRRECDVKLKLRTSWDFGA